MTFDTPWQVAGLVLFAVVVGANLILGCFDIGLAAYDQITISEHARTTWWFGGGIIVGELLGVAGLAVHIWG